MKKALIIIGGVVILGIIAVIVTTLKSNKMVCKSDEGDITIMYTSKGITGYAANGISYDLDGQQDYAEQVGIDTYLDEFATWFSNNTTGSCSR